MNYRPLQYAQALYAACEKKSDADKKKIVRRFAKLLVEHRATGKTAAICAAYEKLVLQSKGTRKVRVETAGALSEKLKTDIRVMLGKNIHIEALTNRDLLGGVKILIDDEILIDASARRQMENLFMNSSQN